jgi:predicted small secreted protein
MTSRGLLALTMLAVWVLLGPVAMIFSGCIAMGGVCEDICATGTALAVPALSTAPGPKPFGDVGHEGQLPPRTPPGVEHPPKSRFLSA